MTKKLKIAIIGSRGYPYVYSGYETFVKELFERLKDKHEIHVYCHRGLFKKKPGIVNGITLHYIPAIEKKSLSQLSHSFLSTLHALFCNYDILLYVNTANGPFGYITKLFGKKTAINTDGLEWCRPKWKGFGAKYFYWASKISTKTFDVIISDSTQMAVIYKEEFNVDSEVIAYGANIGYSENTNLIKKFDLKTNGYYLIVGRLIPDNNSDIILKGFIKSNSKRKLVIVGDVPYNDEFADNIKKNESRDILFTGYVNDQILLKELYVNSYCYFHGHEFGGTNPTLLKALAFGCCILAIDTPFNREVLLNDTHGLYFKKNDDSVCELINQIDENPQKVDAYRAISRDRIMTNYTWEKIAIQYDELFNKMIVK